MSKRKEISDQELFELNETINIVAISKLLKEQGRPLGRASIYLRFARANRPIKFHYKPSKGYVPRREVKS